MTEPTIPTSAVVRAELDLSQEQRSERFAALCAGERVVARVIRLEADGRALVDLAGQRALAVATTELRAGQRLLLEVIRIEPQMLLQIVPPAGQSAGFPAPMLRLDAPPGRMALAELIQVAQRLVQTADTIPAIESGAGGQTGGQIGSIHQALARLVGQFTAAPLGRSTDDLIQWLRAAVEENGLFMEPRLAELCVTGRGASEGAAAAVLQRDLKAQLLLLNAALEHLPAKRLKAAQLAPKQINSLKEMVSTLLGRIEQQQVEIVRQAVQPDGLHLMTYILPMLDPQRPLQLKVFYPKRGSESESRNHQNVALLLDMDRLGAVRADINMLGSHLQIAIYVSDEKVRSYLEPHARGLVAALDGLFDQVQIGVHVSEARIAQFSTEEVSDAVGRVNIRA